MSILEYTALELAGQIKKKEISCREAVDADVYKRQIQYTSSKIYEIFLKENKR